MLFILTGDIQIGKTRWLQNLVDEFSQAGVVSHGVIAPGVWREHIDINGQATYEKLGINNVLLPKGEIVPFAKRRDLAQAEGSYNAGSQSAQAGLGWEISDAAIAQVNEHFATLTQQARQNSRRDHAQQCSPARCQTSTASAAEAAQEAGLLIVDELGQLELKRNGGLTNALALLSRGPSTTFPHAIIVVREWLAPDAAARFKGAWGDYKCIPPSDAARREIAACFNVLL